MSGTIVYIDDDPDLPTGLENELGRIGFRLHHTSSFDQALELVGDGLARVMLIEVLFEDGRGWELIEQIRRLDAPCGDVPIVIYTREERTPTLYSEAVDLGANDFLSRPVIRAEVLGAILECVEASDVGAIVDPIRSAADARRPAEASGSLDEFPLPELLLELREVGASGVLLLQDFEGVVVQLRNGSPIGLASSRGDESFAEYLMRTKRVTDSEYERVLERAAMMSETEPEAVVAIGAMTKPEVRTALEDRSAEPLLEAFAWTSGTWRFEPGKRIRAGLSLERGGARVLAKGVLEWTQARCVRAMLDRRGAHYLAAVERPPIAVKDLSSPICDAELLQDWTGDRTVAQVLASGAIGERELYALLVAGLAESFEEAPLELTLVVDEAPPPDAAHSPPLLELDLEEEVLPEPEPEPVIASPEPERDPQPEAPRTTPKHFTPPPPKPAVVDAMLSGLKKKAKPSPESEGSEEEDEAAKAAKRREAERYFMEGETHLADERYNDAVASFGMASHLDPDQGEYRAHLGYALHLQQPKNDLVQKEALEHIAKGVKLAPERWRPLLYLARVFIATDEHRNALKVLINASRKHPDCEALENELRMLRRLQNEHSGSDESGLTGRFRKLLKK